MFEEAGLTMAPNRGIMKTEGEILCPVCRKKLARARNGAELVADPGGAILLWCRHCAAERGFRYAPPGTKLNTRTPQSL